MNKPVEYPELLPLAEEWGMTYDEVMAQIQSTEE